MDDAAGNSARAPPLAAGDDAYWRELISRAILRRHCTSPDEVCKPLAALDFSCSLKLSSASHQFLGGYTFGTISPTNLPRAAAMVGMGYVDDKLTILQGKQSDTGGTEARVEGQTK
jgi:hypothetical protein